MEPVNVTPMDATDINSREVVAAEFEMVWARTLPGNKPARAIAKYWFREGRSHGMAAHAALDKGITKDLRAEISKLEQLDATVLARRVHRLTEALTELEHVARQLRQSARSGVPNKRDAVRIDAAINNAKKELNKK